MAESIPAEDFDFLAWEAQQEEKHELIDGAIYAMAGGSPAHAQIGAQALVALSQLSRKRGCTVYSSDLKVAAGEDSFVYPDCTVFCDKLETLAIDNSVAINPFLVVEILSPTTLFFDLGMKFEAYQRIPSLMHVLYIHQDQPLVEHRRRQSPFIWLLERISGLDSELSIDGERLLLRDIYQGVSFDAQPST